MKTTYDLYGTTLEVTKHSHIHADKMCNCEFTLDFNLNSGETLTSRVKYIKNKFLMVEDYKVRQAMEDAGLETEFEKVVDKELKQIDRHMHYLFVA